MGPGEIAENQIMNTPKLQEIQWIGTEVKIERGFEVLEREWSENRMRMVFERSENGVRMNSERSLNRLRLE